MGVFFLDLSNEVGADRSTPYALNHSDVVDATPSGIAAAEASGEQVVLVAGDVDEPVPARMKSNAAVEDFVFQPSAARLGMCLNIPKSRFEVTGDPNRRLIRNMRVSFRTDVRLGR